MKSPQKYLEEFGGWGTWVPAITPDEVPAVPGFNLGMPTFPGQKEFADYLDHTARVIWEPLGALKSEVENGVQALLYSAAQSSTVQNIAQWAVKISAGFETFTAAFEQMGAYAQWVKAWGDFVLKALEQTISGNYGRRRSARLSVMRSLQDAGPAQWAGGLFIQRKYTFVDTDLKERWVSCWLNTKGPSPLQYANEANISTGCSGGVRGPCDHLACTREGENYIMIFPLFFPLWSNLACGGGMRASLTRGVSATPDAGSRIWKRCAAMQAALITDPMINLQLDARKVRARIDHLRKYYVDGIVAAGGTPPDPEFVPNKYEGTFWTPGGQVAQYTPDGPLLITKYGVGPSVIGGSANCWGSDSKLDACEVNTAVGNAGQFFALRSAIVRSPYMLKSIRDNAPEMLGEHITPSPAGGILAQKWIPEDDVRALVENPPKGPTGIAGGQTGGGGTGGGYNFNLHLAQTPGAIKPPKFTPITEPIRTQGGGAAILAAAALGMFLLSRKK